MRIIIAMDTKESINKYLNNINHELNGKQIELNEEEFKAFWDSGIVDHFYQITGQLIDDYETTILDKDSDIIHLQKAIQKSTFGVLKMYLNKELMSLVDYANENKSGIIFFL